MTTIIALGLQWGDEGKGKVIDYLCEKAQMVVRACGGANAGHSIHTDGRKYVLHLIPSGIVHEGVRCLLGSGMVISLSSLEKEIAELTEATGRNVNESIGISHGAHIILPWHSELEQTRENSSKPVGSTLRGIGPAYETRASRFGITAGMLAHPELLRKNLEILRDSIAPDSTVSVEMVFDELMNYATWVVPMLADVSLEVFNARKNDARILFEGAQGILLDVFHGTFPYVTSSNTVTGGIYAGIGVGPDGNEKIVGIVKAYTTRVGLGPFPTELFDATGEKIRDVGKEYGATTGRPRRCGWLDLVALRYAVRLSGVTSIALTKVDVLNDFEEIMICDSYIDGEGHEITEFPPSGIGLENCKPVYTKLKGWKSFSSGSLPLPLIDYIRLIEERCGVEVSIISMGPDRRDTIEL